MQLIKQRFVFASNQIKAKSVRVYNKLDVYAKLYIMVRNEPLGAEQSESKSARNVNKPKIKASTVRTHRFSATRNRREFPFGGKGKFREFPFCGPRVHRIAEMEFA